MAGSLSNIKLPEEIRTILDQAPSVKVAESLDQLVKLSYKDAVNGWQEVGYDVEGLGRVNEARVCMVNNGVSANYYEPYMRRRDPECMVIADSQPTDKPLFKDRFKIGFDGVRKETFEWLSNMNLAVFLFRAGSEKAGCDAIAICPENASFFALGLAMLQGIIDPKTISDEFCPSAAVFVAPPFRHTHFDGKQVVVHNRLEKMHEIFSYNLYPGPSAKKGIYGVLLNIGERENWVTAHCSTVKVITPYDNTVTFMHEGASGGGKSEMLEHVLRLPDGQLLLGKNTVTGEKRKLTLPTACELSPVTDDMALCPNSIQKPESGKLCLLDGEDAWFLRVNHITNYGTDPDLESRSIHPEVPLLFLNIDTQPGSTALLWEHIEDEEGKPCPNPRFVLPRNEVPGIVKSTTMIDVRSFGVRMPPCTAENPTYGIMGIFHIIPPALAWLWRLVAPRGHANPSIVDTREMSSEGVGSYWPFVTGKRVNQANMLLQQILMANYQRYILTPNQHVGAWSVGFMPQWLTREYLARRGIARFTRDQVKPSRCSLLGYSLEKMVIEGQTISSKFMHVEKQSEVGIKAYDKGAKVLENFFHNQLQSYLEKGLMPEGEKIIKACLDGASVDEYDSLTESEPTILPERF